LFVIENTINVDRRAFMKVCDNVGEAGFSIEKNSIYYFIMLYCGIK